MSAAMQNATASAAEVPGSLLFTDSAAAKVKELID